MNQSGIGIRNTWTFMALEPAGEKRDIVVNSGDNVQAINPLYISGGVDSWVFELVYDRLARVGPDGLPRNWAAESITFTDDKTVQVKLKSGMKWHDGKPVTVEDVKFSFEAAVSGEAPMYAPFASNIETIEIVDPIDADLQAEEPVRLLRHVEPGQDQPHPEARLGADHHGPEDQGDQRREPPGADADRLGTLQIRALG